MLVCVERSANNTFHPYQIRPTILLLIMGGLLSRRRVVPSRTDSTKRQDNDSSEAGFDEQDPKDHDSVPVETNSSVESSVAHFLSDTTKVQNADNDKKEVQGKDLTVTSAAEQDISSSDHEETETLSRLECGAENRKTTTTFAQDDTADLKEGKNTSQESNTLSPTSESDHQGILQSDRSTTGILTMKPPSPDDQKNVAHCHADDSQPRAQTEGGSLQSGGYTLELPETPQAEDLLMAVSTRHGDNSLKESNLGDEDVEVEPLVSEKEVVSNQTSQDIGNADANSAKHLLERLMPKKCEIFVREKIADTLRSWKACGKMAEIERVADNTPVTCVSSISDLANSLKGEDSYDMESSLSQIALAYKIFCWVTKNIQYDSSARGIADPHMVLKTRKAVCHGYTTLFQAVGTECGLKVSRVDGNYRSIQSRCWSLDHADSHTWNMVSEYI